MGRLASKRRLKACDPFNTKTGGVYPNRKGKRLNAPPKASELRDDNEGGPSRGPSRGGLLMSRPTPGLAKAAAARSLASTSRGEAKKLRKEKKRVESLRAAAASAGAGAGAGTGAGGAAGAGDGAAPEDGKSGDDGLPKLTRLPGESFKQFSRRVHAATQESKAANKSKFSKKVSERHQVYLDRKTDHKKDKAMDQRKRRVAKQVLAQAGLGRHVSSKADDFESATDFLQAQDTVKFGERVEAPPSIKAIPKMSRAGKQQIAARSLARSDALKRPLADPAAEMERLRQATSEAYRELKRKNKKRRKDGDRAL